LATADWLTLGTIIMRRARNFSPKCMSSDPHNSPDDALKMMREAADLEDHNEKHIVTPGRILPARELLGDMLCETGQPVLALQEYEASQRREPNRFRGYYGAARAAEAAGDREKAEMYYGKLLTLAKNGDTERPELAHARAYVGRRG
jgi:hypothetical protein